MIDMNTALLRAAEQVHCTHCTVCDIGDTWQCPGATEVDVGVAAAVVDTFLTHCYSGLRRAVWDAHKTIKP